MDLTLENIDTEKWSTLRVLTGTAEHVPNAVLELLSSDAQKFEQAYWKLDNYVVVQGDLFSAAAVIPKYLEEIVLKTKFKERVIDLLWQIGSGSSKDTLLQEKCYTESTKVFRNLISKRDKIDRKYVEMIEAVLRDLIELHNDRNQST